MKMLSLFSGIGGLDLAAHWAGIETVAGVKHRVARLKADGNAVVPRQAYPIFAAIMSLEGKNKCLP